MAQKWYAESMSQPSGHHPKDCVTTIYTKSVVNHQNFANL